MDIQFLKYKCGTTMEFLQWGTVGIEKGSMILNPSSCLEQLKMWTQENVDMGTCQTQTGGSTVHATRPFFYNLNQCSVQTVLFSRCELQCSGSTVLTIV